MKKKWNYILGEAMASLIVIAGTAVVLAAAARVIIWLLG